MIWRNSGRPQWQEQVQVSYHSTNTACRRYQSARLQNYKPPNCTYTGWQVPDYKNTRLQRTARIQDCRDTGCTLRSMDHPEGIGLHYVYILWYKRHLYENIRWHCVHLYLSWWINIKPESSHLRKLLAYEVAQSVMDGDNTWKKVLAFKSLLPGMTPDFIISDFGGDRLLQLCACGMKLFPVYCRKRCMESLNWVSVQSNV